MKKSRKIIFLENVPLENKGEAAIVLGAADTIFPGETVELAVLGFVEHPVIIEGIHVFPIRWLFGDLTDNLPQYSRKSYGVNKRLRSLFKRFALLTGCYRGDRLFPNHVGKSDVSEVLRFVQDADVLLLGHDGVFDIKTCEVLARVKRMGKPVGVFGSGRIFEKRPAWSTRLMFGRAIQQADFWFTRDPATFDFMRGLDRDSQKVKLAPDPAFGMMPALRKDAEDLLRSLELGDGPVISVTVCENSITFVKSFLFCRSAEEKSEVHAGFLATILDALHSEVGGKIVFLPHTYELPHTRHQPWRNDVPVARKVASRMKTPGQMYRILDQDLSPRLLKSIIGCSDFMLGERTHSLIGSVDVCCPFVGFTNKSDTRTHGIIGEMCQCEDQLVDMDQMDEKAAVEVILRSYRQRDAIRRRLKTRSEWLREELRQAADIVRSVCRD